ncbi:coiled-coil domain-containing protein 15 [Lemur catta]|uniref:coiled-coil domain-containing protein 15 n=1 Tax=Lemur catta TaxID=9447 RepID=UPI001E26C0A8|nr:coiled-coil domain-containing protein 15 [Lemur catta]
MPGSMAPLKKSRKTTRLPLALNPLKSKNVLAVLAERNQAVVPVGVWVEPASANSSEIPAYTSAYIIEEELKEQQRKKQEALKRFQRQVKRRVNQQIRLRKKQQLQKFYEAAEKEGSIAMQSSDPAYLTPKRTSVFPHNLNAAIGSTRLPASQMLEDEIEDGENQNELFQKQAQALSQTMKQARHRLASFKTVTIKKASVFPDDGRKSFPTQEKALSRKPASIRINIERREEFPFNIHQGLLTTVHYQNFIKNQEPAYEESSSIMTDEKGRDLFGSNQQDILSEDKDKPFSRVQKVKFKDPLYVMIEEEEQKQLSLQGLQDILPEAQDYFPEAQGDLLETEGDLTGVQSVELEVQSFEPDTQAIEPEYEFGKPERQAIEPEGQPKTATQGVLLKAQSIELEDGSIVLAAQDFLSQNQTFLPKDQDILPRDHRVLPKDQSFLPNCQNQDFLPKDQDFLPRNQCVLPKDHNVLPKCEDQDFLPKDQDFLPRDQCFLPKDQDILPKCQDQDFLPKDQEFVPRDLHVLSKDQNILLKCEDQDFLPKVQDFLPRDQKILPKYQDQDFLSRDQHVLTKEENILPKCQEQDFLPKDQCAPPKDQYILTKFQDQDFLPKDQENCFWQPESTLTAERWKEEWPTSTQQCILHRFQGQSSTRDQLDQKEEERQEKADLKQPTSIFIGREALPLDVRRDLLCRHRQVSIRGKKVHFKEPYSDMTDEKGRDDFSLAGYQYVPPKPQDQDLIRDQHVSQVPSSFMRDESVREELPLEYHQYVTPINRIQDQASPREQLEQNTDKYVKQPSSFEKWELARGVASQAPLVYDEYQSGLSTEFQAPLAFQSGVDQEEDKKERQKQYLRHRRLFMDIEREQVKEQQRQKEQKKKIEKIKKKREQQRYAEEQRILRMSVHEEPYPEERMSEILAQLQLEEIKGAREKQQQREKEYLRYVEALRAQIQEKMQLYNITLPPLCCCGPDFWDAHPDTCANNCIFYKNHRAYTRALHSVINSYDTSEGNSTLRIAIHNFASAHRRTLKNL